MGNINWVFRPLWTIYWIFKFTVWNFLYTAVVECGYVPESQGVSISHVIISEETTIEPETMHTKRSVNDTEVVFSNTTEQTVLTPSYPRHYGTILVYTCDEEYSVMVGNNSVECLHDGNWTNPPVCFRKFGMLFTSLTLNQCKIQSDNVPRVPDCFGCKMIAMAWNKLTKIITL